MNILDEIVEVKKEEVKLLHRDYSYSRFSDTELFEKKTTDLATSLSLDDRLAVIAEIKKASPSKGVIRSDFNPLQITDTYINNGANAISILTDEKFFQGSLKYLSSVAEIADIPLLRKDFIIDEYQVFEAKANGADAILLIAEILSANQINELLAAAKEHKLSVLLEIHSEDMLNKFDVSKIDLLGINNRNLKTFEVNLYSTVNIAKNLPSEVKIVSESGFGNKQSIDTVKYIDQVKALLVGESFMKSQNIKDTFMKFLDDCYYES